MLEETRKPRTKLGDPGPLGSLWDPASRLHFQDLPFMKHLLCSRHLTTCWVKVTNHCHDHSLTQMGKWVHEKDFPISQLSVRDKCQSTSSNFKTLPPSFTKMLSVLSFQACVVRDTQACSACSFVTHNSILQTLRGLQPKTLLTVCPGIPQAKWALGHLCPLKLPLVSWKSTMDIQTKMSVAHVLCSWHGNPHGCIWGVSTLVTGEAHPGRLFRESLSLLRTFLHPGTYNAERLFILWTDAALQRWPQTVPEVADGGQGSPRHLPENCTTCGYHFRVSEAIFALCSFSLK